MFEGGGSGEIEDAEEDKRRADERGNQKQGNVDHLPDKGLISNKGWGWWFRRGSRMQMKVKEWQTRDEVKNNARSLPKVYRLEESGVLGQEKR